jgi:pyruvate dehydrogenase (quinone)
MRSSWNTGPQTGPSAAGRAQRGSAAGLAGWQRSPAFREGIEFPNPDFAALARACGGHGFAARKPGELQAALSEAFDIDGRAIVDAIVVSNEPPNLPHVDLHMTLRCGKDKRKPVLAVTGG